MTPRTKSIDWDGEHFVIRFPFDPVLIEWVKSYVPGRRWNGQSWTAPISAVESIEELSRRGFILTEQASDVLNRYRASLQASAALQSDFHVDGLALDLHPFQRAGVEYAVSNLLPGKGICFGDEMGLGKTPQALAVVHAKKAYPVIVVVPSSVWLKWAKEVRKWIPTVKVCLLGGKSVSARIRRRAAEYGAEVCLLGEPLPSSDVYVISHANLAKWITPKIGLRGGRMGGKQRRVVIGGEGPLTGIDWQAWILDEAHAFKEPSAKRTKAAQALAAASNAQVKIMCSGTWAPNRPKELLTNLVMLNRLKDVAASEWDYLIRYCNGHQGPFGWDFSGSSNEDELNRRMRSSFYIRREKRDVLPDLPALQVELVDVDLSNQKEYGRAHAELEDSRRRYAAAIRAFESAKSRGVVGDRLRELENIAKDAKHATGVAAHKAHMTVGLGKIDAAITFLEEFLADSGDDKVLVFGIHRAVNEAIAQHFDAPLIYGGSDAASRDDAEHRFENDPRTRILVAHVESGGIGINLTAASHVVFVELPYRPMDLDQPIGRAYGRLSNIHGVNVYILVAPETIDDLVLRMVHRKSEVLSKVISGISTDTSELPLVW